MYPPQPPRRPEPWENDPASGPYERPQSPPPGELPPEQYGQPYQQPYDSGGSAYGPPGYGEPGYGEPDYGEPDYGQQPYEQPSYGRPQPEPEVRDPYGDFDFDLPGSHERPDNPYAELAELGAAGPARPDAFAVEGELGIGGDLDRAFAGARRERAGVMVVSIGSFGAIAVLGISAFVAVLAGGPDGDIKMDGPATMPARPSGRAPDVKGTGKFQRAPAGAVPAAPTAAGGRTLRYVVQVEGGLGQRPAAFARDVETVLTAQRGWTAGGKYAFQRTTAKPFDFVVRLASPATADRLCSRYGLDTGGTENCTGGAQVIVNLNRWLEPSEPYSRTADQRAYIVNHLVGQQLEFPRAKCPGKGQPAPVMQVQSDLGGCRANPWPFGADGKYLTGPNAD